MSKEQLETAAGVCAVIGTLSALTTRYAGAVLLMTGIIIAALLAGSRLIALPPRGR